MILFFARARFQDLHISDKKNLFLHFPGAGLGRSGIILFGEGQPQKVLNQLHLLKKIVWSKKSTCHMVINEDNNQLSNIIQK